MSVVSFSVYYEINMAIATDLSANDRISLCFDLTVGRKLPQLLVAGELVRAHGDWSLCLCLYKGISTPLCSAALLTAV